MSANHCQLCLEPLPTENRPRGGRQPGYCDEECRTLAKALRAIEAAVEEQDERLGRSVRRALRSRIMRAGMRIRIGATATGQR